MNIVDDVKQVMVNHIMAAPPAVLAVIFATLSNGAQAPAAAAAIELAERYVGTDANGQTLPVGDFRDTRTNIVWRHFPKKAGSQPEAEKIAAVDGLHLGTVDEIETLRDRSICKPASKFPGIKTDDWYWSSTPCAGADACAWIVYFGYGASDVHHRNSDGYVLGCRPASQ